MTDSELAVALQGALGAHQVWKDRIVKAIILGRSDFDVATLRRDDCCDMGKLLSLYMPASWRDSPEYRDIQTLHAQFHHSAATALEHALADRCEDACVEMKARVIPLSTAMRRAIESWCETLQGQNRSAARA